MVFKTAPWVGAIGLVFSSVPALFGQTAFRPYGILGPPPLPAQRARTERLRNILVEGWKVTPAEASVMEAGLARNPEDIALRVRLISYYTQYILNEPRTRHLTWLIENHPDADVFEDANLITRTSQTGSESDYRADSARVKALWQQQVRRFPNNTRVLSHAAMAFSADPEIAVQLVEAARHAEPGNSEWTRWLAKIYADAIRWTFWDGKADLTFTGDAEDYLHMPFVLPLSMCGKVKAEMETSTDAKLIGAVGEALVREVRLLREKSVATERSSFITPELQPLADFGETLLRRARILQPKK